MPKGVPGVEDSSYKDNAQEPSFLRRVESHALEMIGSLSTDYSYHCIEHTAGVVRNARAIAASIKLGRHEFNLLLASAWLHDIGFSETYKGHELVSCRIAEEMLKNDVSEADLDIIKQAIKATELPQRADHIVAQALCDADLLYLGTNMFFPWSDRLREENVSVLGKTFTDIEWIDINASFLSQHRYFTQFAKDYCAEGCEHNLRLLAEMRAGME